VNCGTEAGDEKKNVLAVGFWSEDEKLGFEARL